MDKQQRGIQVIRIWLGVTMLIHGVMKVTSLEDTLAFFASIGFSFGLASGFSGYEYELFLAITSLAILVSYADKKYLTLKLYF